MPYFTDILYEKHHRVRGAAWLTINRPDLMNSFTGHTLDEMKQAVEDANKDPAVGVLVITGAGDRAFCAGGDVRWLQEVQKGGQTTPMDPHAGIEDFLKPVIARVNGYSIGGGTTWRTSAISPSPRSGRRLPRWARGWGARRPVTGCRT